MNCPHNNIEDIAQGKNLIIEQMMEVPYYPNGVQAGLPTMVDERDVETMLIPANLCRDLTITAKVHGESMRDHGFQEGDVIVIHLQDVAEDGDIVVAEMEGGQCTLKAFYTDDDGNYWLIPGNPEFSPIPLTEDKRARIVGVVTSILRNAPRVSPRRCKQILNKSRLNLSFPLLTDEAIRCGRGGAVMEELKRATEGTLEDLISTMRQQENLGRIAFSQLPITKLYQYLTDYLDLNCTYEALRKVVRG